MFEGLQKRLSGALSKVRGLSRISESDIDQVLSEIRTGLLEGDVHFRVTKDFLARVRERCLREEVIGSLSPEQQILKVLHEELTQILGGKNRELNLTATPPAVVMMVGLQGSGKTTTTSKLGFYLKSQGKRVGAVSVDVNRPAAMEQLSQLCAKVGMPYFPAEKGEKPVEIAKRAFKLAQDQNLEILLVDTAGRLQVDEELMDELSQIKDKLQPSEILLVVDAMMGQQAVEVAEGFDRRVTLTGSVLSKLDGDTRGGAALSLVAVTGKPIKFIGTGERHSDFEAFHPDRMSSRLLDMGDVLSLLEKAERVITEDEARAASEKFKKSDFSLEDFRDQLKMISRLGSISGLLKMLPGMNSFKDQIESVDTDKELKRINAILNSMTPLERKQPEQLNGSRRARIARGSGTQVAEVNHLVKRFLDARKVMKQMGKLGDMMKSFGGGGAQNQQMFKRGGKGFGRKF